MNPVEAGIVENEEEYIYSSCRDYYEGKNIGKLKIEWLKFVGILFTDSG